MHAHAYTKHPCGETSLRTDSFVRFLQSTFFGSEKKVQMKMWETGVVFAPWVFCVRAKRNTKSQQKLGSCNLELMFRHVNPSLSIS